MQTRPCFDSLQLGVVKVASEKAATLVTDHYKIAPREWREMTYEVKTLGGLDSHEVIDTVLAHTVCYGFRREVGRCVLDQGDLYRICLQDHRILQRAQAIQAQLEAVLTYVLTHELVHVVRFGRRLERIDIPQELRPREEQNVARTTRIILGKIGDPEIIRILPGLQDIRTSAHLSLPRPLPATPW